MPCTHVVVTIKSVHFTYCIMRGTVKLKSRDKQGAEPCLLLHLHGPTNSCNCFAPVAVYHKHGEGKEAILAFL
jgi:hypothetical protein